MYWAWVLSPWLEFIFEFSFQARKLYLQYEILMTAIFLNFDQFSLPVEANPREQITKLKMHRRSVRVHIVPTAQDQLFNSLHLGQLSSL